VPRPEGFDPYATVPKHEAKEREIWDAQTIFKAIELCKDPRLKLCLNLAFSCTLRIGELLALTWDCVDISDESIQAGKASISVTKELQRVSKKAMKALDSKDIITVFPDQGLHNRTALVLKAPKTPTSIRKVFLPKTVAEMLVAWKMEQDAAIEAIGNEYADFNLVIATPVGLPCESAQIRKALKNLIEENNLPPVVFHSLRHSSITYKLKLNQGDIKSVQGDSGHAQASMVTDQYSHILDENRQENAKLLEKAFYNGRGAEPEAEVKRKQIAMVDQMNAMGFDPLQLAKVLSNPDMVKMLQMLAGSGTAT
jgi:integrase